MFFAKTNWNNRNYIDEGDSGDYESGPGDSAVNADVAYD